MRSAWVAILAVVPLLANAAYEECGSLDNGVGPYDYRTQKKQLEIVERFHFHREIEFPPPGNRRPLGGDLDYTLRASPNHHRALAAVSNLELSIKKKEGYVSRTSGPMKGAQYTASCYFDRAVRFAPNDGMVRMVFGMYLVKSGDNKAALAQLEEAQKLEKNNANLHYNLGLLYFDIGDYANSLSHAKQAYALGFTLPGLREKLQKAKKWE
jgi:tetratricopeptide (TPR) repeat protein